MTYSATPPTGYHGVEDAGNRRAPARSSRAKGLRHMGAGRLATMLAAGVLAGLFWFSAMVVGGWLGHRLTQRGLSGPGAAALGLAAYALAGAALGLFGALWWPLLATLALLPSLVRAPLWARPERIRDAAIPWLSAVRAEPVALVSFAVAAAGYAALATLPLFHHDMVVNYLAVPKAFLLAGSSTPLPSNVFSSTSFALHALLAFPVALNALLPDGPFTFGWGTVYGAFHLITVLASVWALGGVLAHALPDPTEAKRGAVLGAVLWLAMPQTALLEALKLVEMVTTFVALALVVEIVEHQDRSVRSGMAAGLIAGLLVAAKAQLGAFAAVAGVVLLVRRRSLRPALGFGAGTLLMVVPQLVRNGIAYGAPLFPYVGGSGEPLAAARDWMSINAVSLPSGFVDLAHRIGSLLALQPETGISLALLPLAFLGRVRAPWLYALAVLPLVALSAASGAAYHVLRWGQSSLVLLFGAAGVGLAALLARRPLLRLPAAAVLAAAMLLAGRFTCSTLGGCSQLLLAPEKVVASHIPSLPARELLIRDRNARVLYLGELDGYYGLENGILPSPHDAGPLLASLVAPDPDATLRRLVAAGVDILAVDRAFDHILGPRAPWAALTADQRAVLGRLLRTLEPIDVPPPVRAFRVGAPDTTADLGH